MLDLLSGGLKVLGGLKSLFGSKPKNVDAGQNLMNLARGARQAAEAHGFNPLTLLQAGAGTSGYTTGGVPPLASVEILSQGFQDINDVTSGDAARRRAVDQLNLDMAKLRFDQARSGVAVAPISAALRGTAGQSVLGAPPVQVYPADGSVVGGPDAFNRLPSRAPASADAQGQPRDVVGNDATRLVVGGIPLEPHPGWSDADYIEQRHGDALSWIYGVGTGAADLYHNAKRSGILADDESDDPRKWSRYKLRQTYGIKPDGFNEAGEPYWNNGGVVTFTPPNKMKGYN